MVWLAWMKETECGGGGSVSVWCAVVNENEPAGGHFGQLARHPNNETKRCDVWGRDMATHIAESKWVKGKRGLWNATSGHCCLPVVCPSVIQWHDVTHLLTRSPNMKCHFSLLDLGKQRVKIRIYCTSIGGLGGQCGKHANRMNVKWTTFRSSDIFQSTTAPIKYEGIQWTH